MKSHCCQEKKTKQKFANAIFFFGEATEAPHQIYFNRMQFGMLIEFNFLDLERNSAGDKKNSDIISYFQISIER